MKWIHVSALRLPCLTGMKITVKEILIFMKLMFMNLDLLFFYQLIKLQLCKNDKAKELAYAELPIELSLLLLSWCLGC